MVALVSQAKILHGELEGDERFCLKVPGILGGDYFGDNVIKASQEDIVASAGRLGQHIKDLPEGTKIDLNDIEYLADY